MAVETFHPNYSRAESIWKRIRDVVAGEDAVKEMGEVYLPQLPEQDSKEYESYKFRASWLNATARTKDGLTGQVFRKDPEFTYPESSAPMLLLNNDADLDGLTIYDYSRRATDEVMETGRAGTLVDWDTVEARPYFTFYQAEAIRDWRKSRINGRTVLSYVALEEKFDADAFAQGGMRKVGMDSKDLTKQDVEAATGKMIRVLRLVQGGVSTMGQDGEETEDRAVSFYVVEIWMEKEEAGGGKARGGDASKKTSWELISSMTPTRRGRVVELIPFVFHGPTTNGSACEVEKAPLLDLVSLNLEHYTTSADFKHGLHFAGNPTAWVAGFPKDTVLRVGSSTAWVSENEGARAGYLEFTGQGLNPLKEYLEGLVSQMAFMGARLLEAQKRAAETAETMTIRQGGESAVLQRITNALGQSLTRAVQLAFWWSSIEVDLDPLSIDDESVSFVLNSDFTSARMSADEVVKLTQAWIQRGISGTTLRHNLEQGEILPPGTTAEMETALIEVESPPMGGDEGAGGDEGEGTGEGGGDDE